MPKTYTLDSAYEQIGYGRMQTLTTWTMAIVRNSGTFAVYCFAFLTLEQQYLCSTDGSNNQTQCKAQQICAAKEAGQDITYTVDESYDYYMNNWYVEMDLVCTPATAVTQMFSVALIGILLCVLFAPL